MDLGHQWTDKELAALEKRIAKLYQEASKEMRGKVEEYFVRHEGTKNIALTENSALCEDLAGGKLSLTFNSLGKKLVHSVIYRYKAELIKGHSSFCGRICQEEITLYITEYKEDKEQNCGKSQKQNCGNYEQDLCYVMGIYKTEDQNND